MREDDSNWFPKWEDELPSPDELMPFSQTLITPDLALAFNIRNTVGATSPVSLLHPQQSQQLLCHQQSSSPATPLLYPNHHHPSSSEFESSSAELGGGGGSGGGGGAGSGEEPARTLKRPRLVWTPQLHKRFVDAVAHLGIKNAVPKTIMQLMSVDGLTRENVASHLQKYRLYLKRMQGFSSGGGGPGTGAGGSGDAATDRLFASSPVPAHFLHHAGAGGGGGRPGSDHFLSYMPVAALHHQHMVAGLQGQYSQHRQMGNFDQHLYLSRQGQVQVQTQFGPRRSGIVQNGGYVEDMESRTGNTGRKVLTLFPTGDE